VRFLVPREHSPGEKRVAATPETVKRLMGKGVSVKVQQGAGAAAADGLTLTITSGWRSPTFQQQLLDDAVATYGSMTIARQYVQTPEHSKHVLGQAVDLGGAGVDQWLITYGAQNGLCQIYANEIWHFELAASPAGVCPPLLPNAA
jgi:LAS superfamily LD-carboxypeptidase LdcB